MFVSVSKIIVRLAGFACCLLFLPSCTLLESPSYNESPSFVVLGDRTGGHRPGVFGQMLEYADDLPATAWLSVGDSIEGYSEDRSIILNEWQEFDHLVSKVKLPLHLVPGNHDISNSLQRDVWIDRYGSTYSSVRYQNVLVLLLDTEDPPILLPKEIQKKQNDLVLNMQKNAAATQQAILSRSKKEQPKKLPGSVAIGQEQLQWAKQTLVENNDAEWVLVVMHKPAWLYQNRAFFELEKALAARNYIVLAGHEHYFNHEKRLGRDYITMATCGGVWLQDGPGRFDHVLQVDFSGQQPALINHIFDGKDIHVDPLP